MLLAPYLFLIIVEVLNVMVYKVREDGGIHDIQLPIGSKQQIMAQYADDTSFILLRKEVPTCNLVSLLKSFCLALGLNINWTMSSGS